MIVIAIANQKGGVGKTTTAINLATGLAAAGRRVLLADLDPQGNASTGLGLTRDRRACNSYDLLNGDCDLGQAAHPTAIPRLDLIPSTTDLSAAEIELVAEEGRAFRLRDRLAGPTARWDICLLDCPPSLGLLTLNALAASHQVLVPLQCEFFALEGLSQLLRTVDRVKASFNPGLAVLGVVLTMYDRRNRLSEQVAQDARAVLGDRVFDTMIPRNVRLSEAPSHGLPALVYDHRCHGSEAYIDLSREVLRRLSPGTKVAA